MCVCVCVCVYIYIYIIRNIFIYLSGYKKLYNLINSHCILTENTFIDKHLYFSKTIEKLNIYQSESGNYQS